MFLWRTQGVLMEEGKTIHVRRYYSILESVAKEQVSK